MSQMQLDCRKMECPQPVMRVRDTLNAAAPESVDVVVDNEPAVENVSRFLASRGYTTAVEKEGDFWRIRARFGANGAQAGRKTVGQGNDKATAPGQKSAGNGGTKILLMLAAPVLGRGDDELGAKLMKNFLATAPELGSNLWRIVLVNGGVTLAVENSPVIAELQTLEKSGAGVFVCGACLQHFNLVEKKAVGQTTNMLDIVASLELADKVIRF
ncbi:MAG: sulfurtransferase-like selenium metabolism protein YedF [Desulfovibrio sp.]|nr:sulfurtransferase-like selenium metabolism protein YedF [Desulfovibrio sp.]